MSQAPPRSAGGREMAVTFDDLPAVSVTDGDAATHRAITLRLLEAVTAHRVPAVGFVNECKLQPHRTIEPERVELLRLWLDARLELGNHTYSHLDLHQTPLERFEEDVVRGEVLTRRLLGEKGLRLRFFRHPYLHTGTDLEVRRGLETFLAARGYTVAPVTIYAEDYLFAAAYDRALQRGDRRSAERVTAAYVPYLERQIEYYERLSTRLLGYEVRQILVLHANALNAETFDPLARAIERRGYCFVSLERALADPAYQTPDTYIAPAGISWLQRWALTRGHDEAFLDGEPLTPRFVRVLSGVGRLGGPVRWWNRWVVARRQALATITARGRGGFAPRGARWGG